MMRRIRNFFANLARLAEAPDPSERREVIGQSPKIPAAKTAARPTRFQIVLPPSAREEQNELRALAELRSRIVEQRTGDLLCRFLR